FNSARVNGMVRWFRSSSFSRQELPLLLLNLAALVGMGTGVVFLLVLLYVKMRDALLGGPGIPRSPTRASAYGVLFGGDSGGLPRLLSGPVLGENGLPRVPSLAILVAEATWSHHLLFSLVVLVSVFGMLLYFGVLLVPSGSLELCLEILWPWWFVHAL